jgi:uncharacterized integral membrane protein (TIGR00698 family)
LKPDEQAARPADDARDSGLAPVVSMRGVDWAAWSVPVLLAALVWLGNPLAGILTGAALSLWLDRRVLERGGLLGKIGLQTAVVLLGFNLDAQTMWQVSRDYAPLVAVYVLLTLAAGLLLARSLKIDAVLGRLIAAGTAICGGTAIATLSPILRAKPDQMAVALAIVFTLNMVALLAFPIIGEALSMSQVQFGVWSALAVHDTSSVVATAAVYGEEAASVAATLKLGRTLWLIPLVLAFSVSEGARGAKIRIPAFILLFILASVAGSLARVQLGAPAALFDAAQALSKAFIVVALFFIGLECTRDSLRNLHGRVVWQALALWAAVVPVTLLVALRYTP